MDPLFLIAIYICIWWTTLFAVLPFGVRTQQEEGSVVPGTPESAPAKPRLLRAVIINTAISSVIFVIVYLIIKLRLITADTFPFP